MENTYKTKCLWYVPTQNCAFPQNHAKWRTESLLFPAISPNLKRIRHASRVHAQEQALLRRESLYNQRIQRLCSPGIIAPGLLENSGIGDDNRPPFPLFKTALLIGR